MADKLKAVRWSDGNRMRMVTEFTPLPEVEEILASNDCPDDVKQTVAEIAGIDWQSDRRAYRVSFSATGVVHASDKEDAARQIARTLKAPHDWPAIDLSPVRIDHIQLEP